jgi:hypothetical protein
MLPMPVCECTRCEIAQAIDSLRCISESTEHSGVSISTIAMFDEGTARRTGLPILSTVELRVKFLGCTGVVEVPLLLTLVGRST